MPGCFWLEQDRLEIPTFENAEGMVDRLVRRELIVRDEIVGGVVEGRPPGHLAALGATALPAGDWA